ncbi:MAG: hypothetical protein HZA34_03575 [Candidatus Pacebacteria bacterium]|nr:hypothetical protein [Candidatus Paceibacterota bacterium]
MNDVDAVVQNPTNNPYMKTFTLEDVEKAKQLYLERKEYHISTLKNLLELLEGLGDKPFGGEQRKEIQDKDRFDFNKLDQLSYNYWEALEQIAGRLQLSPNELNKSE